MLREDQEPAKQEVNFLHMEGEDKETTEKLFHFAVETVAFWAKRLRLLPKSSFDQVYKEIKKMKV